MDNTLKNPVNRSPGKASKLTNECAGTEPSDHELVGRCQKGDTDAYGVLVGRYRQRIFGLAYSMLRNEQDAIDLSQETFVKGWRAIRGFQRNASFYTWLYRITTNLCIDHVRRRDRRPMVSFEETIDPDADADHEVAPSNQPSPTDEAQRGELREQIDAAMLKLSPEHRAVVQLREFDGLDYADIARATGCNIGTVMSRLHYARKQLQKLLKEVI